MANWLKPTLKHTITSGLIVLLSSVSVGAHSTSRAHTTSLADALAQAYTTNPQLLGQQAVVRRADENVISSRANLLPSLTQRGSISRRLDLGKVPFGRDGDAQLQLSTELAMQIYDGGADRLTVDAARMGLLASRQSLKNVEQQILFSTVQAFMDVRRDREFVQLALNNVRVLREQVRAANDRFAVGEVTRTDVSQAQARLAQALSTLATNRGNLMRSVDSYVAVVGSQPDNLRAPPAEPKIPSTVEKAEAVAIAKHPRILQAQFEVKAAELQLQAANKNRYPNISASLTQTIGRTFDGSKTLNENSLTAAISGRVDLYQGGRLDSIRRAALADMERSQANVQLQGYITRQSLRNAYTGWQVARASIVSGREQVRAAQVAFSGVREEAKLGARTTLDTLDAEQEVLTAKSNLVAAIRNEYVAAYSVLSEMGLLTAQHLNLGVPIYNPDVNYTNVTNKQTNPLGLKRLKILEKLKKRKGN